MSERRRLKAGVEVEVVELSGFRLYMIGSKQIPDEIADLITEPIPEEPAEPKVGDEVTAEEPESVSRQAVLADTGAHMSDFIDRRISNLERIWTATMEDLAAKIETLERDNKRRMDAIVEGMTRRTDTNYMRMLEVRAMIDPLAKRIEVLERGERRHAVRIVPGSMEEIVLDVDDVRMASVHPNPKEVMPDAGPATGPSADVAPPPGADEDAPGGTYFDPTHSPGHTDLMISPEELDEYLEVNPPPPGGDPGVEEVLEWLEDIESAFAASVTDAKMPRVAARIIRELGEEIEEWSSLYRRTRDTLMVRYNEMAELRAEVASLTERLTITDEKVKAAYEEQGRHHIRDDPAMVCILTAAGMIDPEVKS